MNQAFMASGYNVTERLHYPRVLHALMGDQAGSNTAESQSNIAFRGEAFATGSTYGFTPTEIQRIGKLYGLDYLAVFAQWPGKAACLRLIDCETAEVVGTSLFAVPHLMSTEDLGADVAQIFVLSLRYAAEQKDAKGNPVPVYIDVSSTEKNEGKLSGIKKLLYQERLPGGTVPRYAAIYIGYDD